MSLSPTNTHTNAGSCPRQEHEHPGYQGDRDPDLLGYHASFHFHPISACSSFALYNYNLRERSHPLSSMLAQGHAYMLSILILVWGRITFHPHAYTCTTVAKFYALHKHSPLPD